MVNLSWLRIGARCHYSDSIATKKAWTKSLPTPEALRSPHRIDKSKAHASWREHFANLF